jgi:hypothetical protein
MIANIGSLKILFLLNGRTEREINNEIALSIRRGPSKR